VTAPEKIGKYEIKRQIGRGAMGAVFEAYDSVIERRVALKLLRVDVFEPNQMADVRARFKREAHSAGRLSHPHIVTIFDYGEHEGTPYIVMDFMSGKELSHHLDGGRRMPLGEVVRVMGQLLGALAYAHESGVVHRDIKPANIFVLHDGSLKVVDFGVARIEASELTDTGAMIGTPAYMSPEQFLGLPVDARSDIFSCGVILYQLLTGDKPFTGSVTTIMQKVLRQDPVEPSALNPTLSHAWDAVVKRALAKKPDARYLSARQFSESIRAAHEARAEPSTEPTVMNVTADPAPPQTQVPAPERTYEKTVPLGRAAGASQPGTQSAPGTQSVPGMRSAPGMQSVPPMPSPGSGFPHLAVALTALVVISLGAGGWWLFLRPKAPEPVVAVAPPPPPPAKPAVDEAAEAKKRAAAEAAERAKAEAEMRARVETEVRSKLEAETRAKADAAARARADAAARAKADAAARARADAEALERREATRRAAEAKARSQIATPQAAPARAAPAAPVAAAPVKQAPSPYRGKVVSLQRDWGFVIVESQAMGGVRLGDRLAANLTDGRRVELTVRRISGNLVSATPEGKLLDELLGAAVGPK
jgi:serine/threonine protein kinase